MRQGRHSSNNVLHALKPDTKNLIRKHWDLAPGTKCGGTSFGVFRMSQGFQPSLFKKGTTHEPLRTTLAPSSLFRVGNIFIYVNTANHKFHIPSIYSCGRLTRPMASAVDFGWRFQRVWTRSGWDVYFVFSGQEASYEWVVPSCKGNLARVSRVAMEYTSGEERGRGFEIF